MHLHVTVESNHSLYCLFVLRVVLNEVCQYFLCLQLLSLAFIEDCKHPHQFDAHGNMLTCHSQEELSPAIALQLARCVKKLFDQVKV